MEKESNIQATNNVFETSTVNATNSRTLFAEVEGRKIAYRSIGKGYPIILCQRFRGNLDSWDPAFLDALAKHYHVVIFDYTGFGSSTGAPPTNVLAFAHDVKDLASALNFDKIIVGGWSIGGFVAQIVTTEFPELVSQAILIGTKPPGKVEHPIEDIFIETAYKPTYDLEDEVVLFFEPASEASRLAAAESHARISARTTDRDTEVPQELWQYYKMCSEDYALDKYGAREKIINTNIPVLVISPDHELCFPPENWFVLNRKTKAVQMIVIPQAGHGVQHQYPELVAEYIHAFTKNNNL